MAVGSSVVADGPRRCQSGQVHYHTVAFADCLTRSVSYLVSYHDERTMSDEASVKVIAQGVEGPPNYDQPSSPPIGSPTESKSSFVKRTVERAADKLHRSKSPSKAQLSQSQPSLSLQGHASRSVFHRSSWKGKERAVQGGKGTHTASV